MPGELRWGRMAAGTAMVVLLGLGVGCGCAPKTTARPGHIPDGRVHIMMRTPNGDLWLSDFRGKVVLVDFWATWCPGCRSTIPVVEHLYRTYHSRGLEVIGPSFDRTDDVIQSYAQQAGITYPVGRLLDDRVKQKYGFTAIPCFLLVNRQGVSQWRFIGLTPETEVQLETQLVTMLGQ